MNKVEDQTRMTDTEVLCHFCARAPLENTGLALSGYLSDPRATPPIFKFLLHGLESLSHPSVWTLGLAQQFPSSPRLTTFLPTVIREGRSFIQFFSNRLLMRGMKQLLESDEEREMMGYTRAGMDCVRNHLPLTTGPGRILGILRLLYLHRPHGSHSPS